jgi:acetyl-CoA carboxylase carboxyl transferase subunit beta
MHEGMAALVGIPRAALALDDLAAARVAHIAVADQPTTGGVWVAIASRADLRLGVAGATVGFSGPRVVEAMTGESLPATSHTAESAYAAGLLDGVAEPSGVEPWLAHALAALAPHAAMPPIDEPAPAAVPTRGGWLQVDATRSSERPSGSRLIDAVLDGAVDLRSVDPAVRATVGRSAAGRATVAVALSQARNMRPGPAGYAVLQRAAELADRSGADLLTFVDTPGADPGASSEAAGIAPAIGAAMTAVLRCRTPTLAVVHGEGGSGGALAAATTDALLVAEFGYFAVLGPEGAAATLRLSPADAADRIGLTPADLLELGFADAMAPADPAALRTAVAARLAALGAEPDSARFARRHERWSRPLPAGYGG